MKHNTQNWIIGMIIASMLIAILMFSSNKLPFTGGLTSFTPIFCNDYEFTCCNEHKQSTGDYSLLTDDSNWQCPLNMERCSISTGGYSGSYTLYKGKINCISRKILFNTYFSCDDKNALGSASNFNLYPGEYVWSEYGTNIQIRYENYIRRLDFTGPSASTTGIKVLGSDKCTFTPNTGTIYNADTLIKQSAVSYIVPLSDCVLAYQSGNRHICGYKEETCASDSDCSGHTYGNKECIGRTLQTYGCISYGTATPLEKDRLPIGSNSVGWGETSSIPQSGQATFGKRCEIKEAKQVQCCGDTDCGSNYFCDKTDFVCKPKVQCTQDSDCGVSIQCDFANKLLKKPSCVLGSCTYQSSSVECCSDNQCPGTNSFCSIDYKCRQGSITRRECPFDCCDSEELYFDKACPSAKPYCQEHTCKAEQEVVMSQCKSCDEYALSRVIGSVWKDKACKGGLLYNITFCSLSLVKLFAVPIMFILVLILLPDLLSSINSIKKNKAIVWGISLIIAGLLAWAVWTLWIIGIIIFIILIALKFIIRR